MNVARGLGLLVIALVGLRLLAFGAADQLAARRPDWALILDPGQVRARLILAGRALDAGDKSAALAQARAALRANPLSAPALGLIAVAVKDDDPVTSARLIARAATLAMRDLPAQAGALDQALSAGDGVRAARRIDILLRGQPPEFYDRTQKTLAPLLTHAALREPITDVLAARPPWRRAVLQRLPEAADLDGLAGLMGRLQQTAAPPDAAELRPTLQRLVAAQRSDEAYWLFVNHLPADALAGAGLLYNADFGREVSNLPFDWQLLPISGAQAVAREKRLIVDFLGGRIPFEHVIHLVPLAPGRYVFSGREQAQGLRTARGLRWRIACLGPQLTPLGETPLLRGDVNERAFSLAFNAPHDCVAQLRLELDGRVGAEQEIAGRASYSGLQLRHE